MSLDSTRTFDDFCRGFRTSPLPGNRSKSFGLPAMEPRHFFVPPILLEKDDHTNPVITLVSARGAAGKSTAAKELANRLDAPLWRLDLDSAVGATSLEYALGRYLESHDVITRIDGETRPLIVIDSLDEARARVSAISWREFIESLGRLAHSGLHYVLFGRERTLEDLWATLSDLGLSVAWWEISHLAPAQSTEYVDGVVAKREPGTDCSSAEYLAARDALIDSLRSATEGAYAEAFAGYPPVLDAVAAMLIKRPNFLALRQQFEDQGPRAEGRIDLLQGILDRLLRRDQTKVADLANELALDPNEVYSPREQIGWLCHFLEKAEPPKLAHITDVAVRQEYVKRITAFADDHPFRSESKWASPVFEAYVASIEFDDSVFSPSRIIEIGDTSGLLLDFVGAKPQLIISEPQFAALHASIIASEWTESTTSTSIDQIDTLTYEGEFAMKRGREGVRVTKFELSTGTLNELQVLGPLAELSIRSDSTVIVPGKPQGIVLGPDLFIRAKAVRFEGPALEFARRPDLDAAGDQEPSVVIEAVEALQLPLTSTQLPPTNEFELRVPSTIKIRYPWYEYRLELVDEELPDQKVIRFLNKLMNLTRAHGHSGERGVFIRKFQGRQPFTSSEFNVALEALIAARVVRIDDEIVFLRQEWEAHRYSGKALKGQRQFADVKEAWSPVIRSIEKALSAP
ncbi:hypothetical protein [Micromonospora sp. NPDC047527]|uniref:hypothetical protein n=1 Tax=unclassified Micromonospora TaxID=2617518 RepID=UPI0033FAE030